MALVVKTSTDHIKFSPKVDKLVQSLDVNSLKTDIAYLTGEDPSSPFSLPPPSFLPISTYPPSPSQTQLTFPSLALLQGPILSRHSFSSGAVLAATYLKETVEDTGANCTLVPFLVGFAPNVICEYGVIGKSADRVVVSGHYDVCVLSPPPLSSFTCLVDQLTLHADTQPSLICASALKTQSRGSFGSTRAPGGDDDASGTGSVLAIARAIKRAGIKGFRNKVRLVSPSPPSPHAPLSPPFCSFVVRSRQ